MPTRKFPLRATEHEQCDHMMCPHDVLTWTDSHFTSPTASVPKSPLRGQDALSSVRTQGAALTFIGGKSEDQNPGGGALHLVAGLACAGGKCCTGLFTGDGFV